MNIPDCIHGIFQFSRRDLLCPLWFRDAGAGGRTATRGAATQQKSAGGAKPADGWGLETWQTCHDTQLEIGIYPLVI